MKKLWTILPALLLILALLTGCGGGKSHSPAEAEPGASSSQPEESAPSPEPEQSEPQPEEENPDDEDDEEEEEQEALPFVLPGEAGDLAAQLQALVESFSVDYPLPAFDRIAFLPYGTNAVNSNLYQYTLARNQELLAEGRGLDEETARTLLEDEYSISAVRYDDMNYLGRQLFGDDFSLPREQGGSEVGPLESNPDYFGFLLGRGGWNPCVYLPRALTDTGDAVTVEFYLFLFSYSWDDGSPVTALSLNAETGDFQLVGYFQLPEDPTVTSGHGLAQYLMLTVPQEELDTVTVTFLPRPGGYTIASCRYNSNRVA